MTTTETTFMTIKDASEKYGKAEITIRRLVRSIVNTDKHEDRGLIEPSVKEVAALKKKRKPFTYSISPELLEKTYASANAKPSKKAVQGSSEYTSLLKQTNDGLQEQLKVKDDQIRALNQALDDLSERQRETNILMKGLQEQFLLGSGSSKSKKIVEAKDAAASKNVEKTAKKASTTADKPAKKKEKSWLSAILG